MKRLCVSCGSHMGNDPAYGEAAHRLGMLLGKRGVGVVFGGGHEGMMNALAAGALSEGGEVIGVFATSQLSLAHKGLTGMVVTDELQARKKVMFDHADGMVALPGGLGTLEEFFEMMALSHVTPKPKPVGLINVNGYYDLLLEFFRRTVDRGMMPAEQFNQVLVASGPEEMLERLDGFFAANR